MVEPTNAEKELRQAAKVDQRDDQSRQDFLASLTRAVSKLSDDDIDQLSSGAQDWYDQAVDAVNNKTTIPEIGDEGPIYDNVPTETAEAADDTDTAEAESADEPEATEPKANGSVEHKAEDAAQTDLEDATKADDSEQATQAAAADDKPAKGKAKASGSKSKAKASSGAKKASGNKSKAKADDKAKGADTKAAKAKGEKAQKKPAGSNKDKFGCVVGSRRAEAAKMFERGATMGEVREHFGGNLTFYNLLNKLRDAGHHVEKTEDKKIKLTHKDEA